MSALFAQANAVIPHTGVDLSAKEGYLVKGSGASAPAVNDSATVPAVGVVLEGNTDDKQSSIGLLGALDGLVRVKLGGTVKKFDRLMQKADGTVEKDGAAGARVLVGTAAEDGVAGDLALAALTTPVIVAA